MLMLLAAARATGRIFHFRLGSIEYLMPGSAGLDLLGSTCIDSARFPSARLGISRLVTAPQRGQQRGSKVYGARGDRQ